MEKTLEATRLLGLCRGLESAYIPSFRTYDRKVMGIRSGINMVIGSISSSRGIHKGGCQNYGPFWVP